MLAPGVCWSTCGKRKRTEGVEVAIFVSMLRGINVTGHRKIRMAELREAYEELGFSRVESYLQSGNVVFDGGRKAAATIVKSIEKEIASRFGHDVSVILRTPAELTEIVEGNPFLSRRGIDPAKLHVTFLPKASGKSSALASAERSFFTVPTGTAVRSSRTTSSSVG